MLTKNSRRCITVHARECTPAQRTIYMDIAIGKNFRTGTDGAENDRITALRVNLLSRTHQLPNHQVRHRFCGWFVADFIAISLRVSGKRNSADADARRDAGQYLPGPTESDGDK